MKKSSTLTSLFIIISFFLTGPAWAQSTKTISEKDKDVIINIFKTIDPNLYRLEFNKSEVHGAMELPDSWVNALRSGIISDVFSQKYLYGTYPSITFWFFINKQDKGLQEVLGKSNTSRLNAVLTKYQGGPAK